MGDEGPATGVRDGQEKDTRYEYLGARVCATLKLREDQFARLLGPEHK